VELASRLIRGSGEKVKLGCLKPAPREELQNLHTTPNLAAGDFSSKENVLQRLVKAIICIVILRQL
jgi:hypothetical protein